MFCESIHVTWLLNVGCPKDKHTHVCVCVYICVCMRKIKQITQIQNSHVIVITIRSVRSGRTRDKHRRPKKIKKQIASGGDGVIIMRGYEQCSLPPRRFIGAPQNETDSTADDGDWSAHSIRRKNSRRTLCAVVTPLMYFILLSFSLTLFSRSLSFSILSPLSILSVTTSDFTTYSLF